MRFLFGSPDRTISTISLIVGVIGLVVTLLTYQTPAPVPAFIVTRDILLIVFLLLFIVLLSLKYFKKDELAEQFRNLFQNQYISSHQLAHKFRDHFFVTVRQTFLAKEFSKESLEKVSKKYIQKVCHSVLTDTRKVFQEYFLTRGFKMENDIAVTLKMIITQEEAQTIEAQLKGEKADSLSSNQGYIITAFRDPETWERKQNRKEVRQLVYRTNEENTAFDVILNEKENFFYRTTLKNCMMRVSIETITLNGKVFITPPCLLR